MINEAEVLDLLGSVNGIITNSHIVYTSGKHGSAYVNKDAIYPHTSATSRLCQAIAEHFAPKNIDAVLAPAVGGVILSQWTAHHLSGLYGREVLGVYAEKAETGDSFVIKRGYDRLIAGKNVLVVEDVLTTGGSVKKVVETANAIGAKIVGVGALCNRGGISSAELGNVPELYALVNVTLDAWEEATCPLCAKGVPINTNVGKGREYLASKK